jgi:hypothetical protein
MTADLQPFTTALIGLPVSRVSNGCGSAIFLQLGRLREERLRDRCALVGEAGIGVEWDWRIECGTRIVGGSSTSRPAIQMCLEALVGARIESIEFEGPIRELVVRFSTGHILRTMAMFPDDPQWTIRSTADDVLHACDGELVVGGGFDPLPEYWLAASDLAESTAQRWGQPEVAPVGERCGECRWFVRLDGTGHFLDYGCCAGAASPRDGRVVHQGSGCPAFEAAADV